MQIKKEIVWNSAGARPKDNGEYLVSVQKANNGVLEDPQTKISYSLRDAWDVDDGYVVIAWAEMPSLEDNSAFVLGK